MDGYAMSSWDRGYGDFVLVPDMTTLRRVPWQDGTAMVIADLTWLDGAPVVASPRQILKAQTQRLAERGLGTRWWAPSWSSSCTATRKRVGGGQRVPRPHSGQPYNVDYSVLGTARIEPLLRRVAQRDGGRPGL